MVKDLRKNILIGSYYLSRIYLFYFLCQNFGAHLYYIAVTS